MSKPIVALCTALLLLSAPAFAADVWVDAMDLRISLDPGKHRIEGEAVLSLAPAREAPAILTFQMAAGLTVTPPEGMAFARNEVEGWWREIEIEVPAATKELRLRYSGRIYDAVEKSDALAFVVGDDTHGVIGEEGVFLVAGSGWYPLTNAIVTFRTIEVDGPGDWRVVTQGELAAREVKDGREKTTWRNTKPMDGLALQAGNYVVTTRDVDGVKISTYLFPEDQKHSKLFLDETARYLEFYTPILGPYPWPKFDIVENFFTTGYGMPSFTLLGKKVMPVMVMMAARNRGRIPPGYIDHEMVHCWWGNYVYPDYQRGNWCEGLTSWYSNYLMKDVADPELARAHRQKISTTFAIRVDEANDYPVREFRGKTEDFENDIGYGKACMVFHMLATRVGYETYFETMRGIIRDFGGKRAAWDDFEAAFSKAAGEDLGWYFDQWLDRKGAPRLHLGPVTVTRGKDGLFRIAGEILQDGKPWRLRVPVTVNHPGGEVYKEFDVAADKTAFVMVSPRMPLSVAIDERFHLFRHVPLAEIQPCLNLTLERSDKVYVVPESNTDYSRLAGMAVARKGGRIVSSKDGLPANDCVVFGRPEANPAVAKVLAAAGAVVEGNAITIRGKKYEGEDLWVLLSIRHPEAEGKFVTVYFGMTKKALARSFIIFHYGWDGHLVYAGRRPLSRGDFTKITPRTIRTIPIEADAARIEKTVRALAAPEMKGRLTGVSGAKAFVYVEEQAKAAGADHVAGRNLSFPVLDFDDPDAWTVRQGKLAESGREWATSYPGAVIPAVFSKRTELMPYLDGASGAISIKKIATYPAEPDDKTLLVLPPMKDPASLIAFLTMLVDSPAAALAIPMKSLENKAMQGLAAYPSRVGGVREAAGRQARVLTPPFELPMPVVFLDERIIPPGGGGPADARLRVAFKKKLIAGRNLVVTILPPDRGTKTPAIGLCAHFDGCGDGYPSADDNASGVAAVLETVRALVKQKKLLGRPVRVFFTDAEEWGLRGSRALAGEYAKSLLALVNVDTVGAADQTDVYVIGRSHYPHLSARAIACFEAEGFPIGKDIDRYAFAHGSDHWSFHRRGIPSIDLWSGQYRRMNTPADTIDKLDFEKIARISRATTRLVLDLASER